MSSAPSHPGSFPPPGSLLFVYGTLKRGLSNHHCLLQAGAEFLSTGRTACRYPLLLREYPMLLDLPGRGHHVTGELYRIPGDTAWQLLDELEDHPSLYQRKPASILTPDNTTRQAWTYFYVRPGLAFTDAELLPSFL